MVRPELTDEQKKSFEKKFKELISKEPETLKDWDGQFHWILGKPKLDHIVKSFSPKSKDKYVTLLNKLINRTI
jgi:hypothetical protein